MKSIDRISTDELVLYLTENGFDNIQAADYSKAELISLIKDNEATANRSNNGLDAKAKVDAVIYGKVETDIIKNILDKIYQSNLARIKKYPTQDKPTANIVTGPPGAGKNYAIDKVIRSEYEDNDADNENYIKIDNENYISGDNIKEDFQKAVQASDLSQETKTELDDSSFVHRLTSDISWKLFADSKELKKNFILEMLGMSPEQDSAMYLDLEENGYDVNIINVLTTTTKSIDNAINRYFSMGGEDGGRYVGITHMAMTHEKQLLAFIETMRILKRNGSKVNVNTLDNSMLEMLSIYLGPVGDMNVDELDEMFDSFINIEALGSDLWFTGDNHAVDLSLFSHDEEGNLVVALIKRGQEPFKDSFALPGGFVNTESHKGEEFKLGKETHEEASKREFLEETGLPISSDLTEIGYYDDPARDPRNVKDAQVVSTAYSSYVDTNEEIIGLDDASEAKWVKVSDISSGKIKLAFDHSMILNDSLEEMAHKIEAGKKLQMKKILDTVEENSHTRGVNVNKAKNPIHQIMGG